MLLITAGCVQFQFEPLGQHLEESARPCRTTVVHGKILDRPVRPEPNDLAVLTADVHHGPRFRPDMVNAHGVAGDLGDRPVGKADDVAAIAGGGARVHPLGDNAALGQQSLVELPSQPILLHALVGGPGGEYRPALPIEQHDLDRSRAGIDSARDHARILRAASTSACSRVRSPASTASVMEGTSISITGRPSRSRKNSWITAPSVAQ
jgi:hypothetical protein